MSDPTYKQVQAFLRAVHALRQCHGQAAIEMLSAKECQVLFDHVVGKRSTKVDTFEPGAFTFTGNRDTIVHWPAGTRQEMFTGPLGEGIIDMIRWVRLQTGVGLREAKNFVDGSDTIWIDTAEKHKRFVGVFGTHLKFMPRALT